MPENIRDSEYGKCDGFKCFKMFQVSEDPQLRGLTNGRS